jgi:hypothetical protein
MQHVPDRGKVSVSDWTSAAQPLARELNEPATRGSAPTLFSALDAFCAKEDSSRRGEFALGPAGVNPFEHGHHERALEIRADWQ